MMGLTGLLESSCSGSGIEIGFTTLPCFGLQRTYSQRPNSRSGKT